MVEGEPKSREQFPKAPDGTYELLKEHDGFMQGRIFLDGDYPGPPDCSLLIFKEENCDRADACMQFLLCVVTLDGDTLIDTETSGHITDHDGTVDLVRNAYHISQNGKYSGGETVEVKIEEVMQEVCDALLVLQDEVQAPFPLPQNP